MIKKLIHLSLLLTIIYAALYMQLRNSRKPKKVSSTDLAIVDLLEAIGKLYGILQENILVINHCYPTYSSTVWCLSYLIWFSPYIVKILYPRAFYAVGRSKYNTVCTHPEPQV